ncbi:MAG: hypothetical protein LBK73_12375 [Treponema sp.]|jgi:hypothetical protein|nr:hypothetical protein [Treponema sp.]
MKKITLLAIALALITGFINAQEEESATEDQSLAQEQEQQSPEGQSPAQEQPQQAAMQMPPPALVKLWFGDLTVHGRLMTGVRAAMTDQEGLAQDGNWSYQAMNADWQENRGELMFDYSMGGFGAFLGLQSRSFDPASNGFGDLKVRYGFLYGNFGMAKLSVGMLYDEILIMQNKVWKTEGYGDLFRFTNDELFSARLEIKPPAIPGLNVGAQFFFVDAGHDPIVSSRANRSLADTGAWKEIGLGAMYTSKLFNAQLGVRFDSDADIMSRDEGKTYLTAYYGDGNMLGTAGAPFYGPKYKHKDEVIGKAIIGLLPGKDGTGGAADYGVTGYEDTPTYDSGHYAFFGFKLNRINNHLEADAHGGLYNLGAFDKFGYGRFAERITYYNLLPKFNLGVILQQEFYGSDVWDSEETLTPAPGYTMANPNYRVNAPFLQFAPWLAYDLAYLPGTNNTVPMIQLSLTPFIGISPGVLDMYVYARGAVNIQMGIASALFFYDFTYEKYVESANIEPATKHVIGCALNIMF